MFNYFFNLNPFLQSPSNSLFSIPLPHLNWIMSDLKWKRILHFYVPCFSSFLFKSIHSIRLFLSQQYGLNNQMNNEYSFTFWLVKMFFAFSCLIPLISSKSLFSFNSFSHNNQQQYHYKSTYIFFSIHSLSHSISFPLYNKWKQWILFKYSA